VRKMNLTFQLFVWIGIFVIVKAEPQLVGTYFSGGNDEPWNMVTIDVLNNIFQITDVNFGPIDEFLYGTYDPITNLYAVCNSNGPAWIKFADLSNFSAPLITVKFPEESISIFAHEFFSARSVSIVVTTSLEQDIPVNGSFYSINLRTWEVNKISDFYSPVGYGISPTPMVIDSMNFEAWLVLDSVVGINPLIVKYDLISGILRMQTKLPPNTLFDSLYYKDTDHAYLTSWTGGSSIVNLNNGQLTHLKEPILCNGTSIAGIAGAYDIFRDIEYDVFNCSTTEGTETNLFAINTMDGSYIKIENVLFSNLYDVCVWQPL